jgi:hypothetical protein
MSVLVYLELSSHDCETTSDIYLTYTLTLISTITWRHSEFELTYGNPIPLAVDGYKQILR